MALPLMIEAVARSYKGQMHHHANEDQAAVFPDLGLAVVADGMGGHNTGDAASSLAVATIERAMRASVARGFPAGRPWHEHPLVEAVRRANEVLFDVTRTPGGPCSLGSATTVVAACAVEQGVLIAHAGDSRCYRLRDRRLAQLTHDHTLINEWRALNVDLTEEQIAQIPRNIITRALGVRASGEFAVDVRFEPLAPGDVFLLCSDGLTALLSDGEIAGLLGSALDLTLACERLCAEVTERLYRDDRSDDTSVVLARWG